MKLLALYILLKVIQTTWVDANYTQLNTVQCNNIYPFSFQAEKDGTTTPRLIDWDLQDFSNFYAFEKFSATVKRNYQVNNKSSYVAILFEDALGLQVGVTYETERAFKWLKVIKNAKPGGQSTLKIASFQNVTNTTVTTSVRDGSNDSNITVAYESTDPTLIYIVTFKFLDGSVICGYSINKGTTSDATSVQSKVVWQSALYTSTLSSEKAIHFVFGLNNLDALEIHYTLNQDTTLPAPSLIFNYKQIVTTRANVNSNFSKVLGISANSISQFQNASIGPFGGKNLNFYDASISSLFLNDTTTGTSQICCSGTSYKSGATCGCGSWGCYTHDTYYGQFTQFSYKNTYLNSLLFNVQQGRFNWYYSATAFLVETPDPSPSTLINNQIYWYVSQVSQDSTQKQQLRELTYSFKTYETLTSYAVSQDAPGLCMTAGVSSGSQSTNIYLDDFRIQGELRLNQGQYQLCASATPNTKETWSCLYPNDMVRQIGLKTFQVGKSVKCRAQNTQVDQLHWGYGQSTVANQNAICWVSTTILLEETSSFGTVIHLLQLKYPRTKSINYDSMKANSASFVSPNPYDCSAIPQTSSQLTYVQYSFLLPEQNFVGFMKSYLNFGFTFSPNSGGTPLTQDDGLYFYIIGVQNSYSTYITVETNNYFMRQTNLTKSSVYDLTSIIDLDFNSGSVFPITVLSNGESFGVSEQLTNQIPVPLQSTYFTTSQISGLYKDIEKWNEQYNWDFTIQPRVFFQDPSVQQNLMCIELSQSILGQTNKTINFLGNQTNILKNSKDFSSMQFNLWPYSNCKDRQLYPPSTQTTTLNLTDYFIGVIRGSTIQQSPASSTLNFTIDKTTGNMSFNISPSQNVYGFQQNQNFQFAIGRDSQNASWQQPVIILDSCNPNDLIWQVMQDKRTPPITFGVIFGQLSNFTLPKVVISTKTLQDRNIDTNYYPELFKYQLYYQKGTSFAQFGSDVMNISKAVAQFNFAQGAKDSNFTCTVYVKTLMPYSYINQTSLKVVQSYINVTTIVQPLIYLQVVNNLAPQFQTPLQDQVAFAGKTSIYSLPDIVDPDSAFAQLYLFFVKPKTNFISLIKSGNQYGNQVVFMPVKSDIGSYTVYVRIQDGGQVIATTINLFQLVVKAGQSDDQPTFVTPSSIKEYTPISNYQMNITKITSEADVYLLFNRQTSLYINQNIAKNVTVIDYVPSILQVSHFQTDQQTKITQQLATPNYRVKSFNGNTLVIGLSFPDQALLSQSLLQKVDSVSFYFNNTRAFVTQNGYNTPEQTDLTLQYQLPILAFGSQSRVTQVILQSVNSTSDSFKGILTANFVLNIIMSTSLQALWSTLNIMQLMLHTPLLNIVLPTTSYVLCNSLIQVTSFQIIDTDKMTSYIFNQDQFSSQSLSPMNDRYSSAGYSYQNIIYNLGLIFYIFLFVIVLATLSGILKLFDYIVPNYIYLAKKIPEFIDSYVKFSWFLRYFIEGNFVFLVCAQMQMNVFNSITSWVDYFSNALAISLLLLSLIMPILCYVKIRNIFISGNLDDENELKKYGELYEAQLHENPKLSHVVYNIALMVRRIVVSVCLFYMDQAPAFQIGFQLMMCVYWTGYAFSERPFEDPSLNWLDFFNNICYYFVLMVCYCLTSFNNQSSYSFEYLGWAFNGLILGMLLANMIYMLVGLFHNIILRFKRLFIRIKYGKPKQNTSKQEDIQMTRQTQMSQADQINQQSESDTNNLVNAKVKNFKLFQRKFKEDKPYFANKFFSNLKLYKKTVKIQRSQPNLTKKTNLLNQNKQVQKLVWEDYTRNESSNIHIDQQSIQSEELKGPQLVQGQQPAYKMQVAQPPTQYPPQKTVNELIDEEQEYIRLAKEANSELKRNFYLKRAKEIASKISQPPASEKQKIPIPERAWAQNYIKDPTPYEYPFSFQRQQNIQKPAASYQEPIKTRVQNPKHQSLMLQDFDLDNELELVRKAGW